MQETMDEFPAYAGGTEAAGQPAHTDETLGAKFVRWQTLVSVISTAIALCSGVCGGLHTLYVSRELKMQHEAAEWESAMKQVSFNGHDVVKSALLIEGFERSDYHSDEAVRTETELLSRFEQPEMFDVIYWDMVGDKAAGNKKRRASAALDLGRSLKEQLHTEYELAMRKTPPAARPAFTTFLENPAPFLKGESSKRAARTLVLLYELDTVSDGVRCIWGSNEPGCPHFSYSGFNFSEVQLLNYPLAKMPEGAQIVMMTCKVHPVPGEAEYECM